MADAVNIRREFNSNSWTTRRRFCAKFFWTAAGVAGTGSLIREFYQSFLKGLGGMNFEPYIGANRVMHLKETCLDGGDSYRTAEFRGFNLVIDYARLVSHIWWHKIGPRHIYDPRITRTLAPVYEGINDFLITEISRTLVEQLDPRSDLLKCLILKEGLRMIISEQSLPDGKPRPHSFRMGLKKFTERLPNEFPYHTGFELTDTKDKKNERED
jgi:hypothetical protein